MEKTSCNHQCFLASIDTENNNLMGITFFYFTNGSFLVGNKENTMQSSMPFSFNCGPGLQNEPGPLLLFCQGLSGLLFRPGHYSSMVYYLALYGSLKAWEGINNNPNGIYYLRSPTAKNVDIPTIGALELQMR